MNRILLKQFDLRTILLTGLSLSIGWGIRGNFGHEIGAMVPGALAAMAVVLLSGREDWHRRIAYFAMFGAIGWSFGGGMSYGMVIGYTHSGHSASVLYGFASLFVIGFLWGAIGGAATALPAILDRARLTEFFVPLIVVFATWMLQEGFENWLVTINSDYRQESPLYWYDSDWLAAVTAIVALLALAAFRPSSPGRRRFDQASSLMLHMAVGWLVAFIVLVPLLGIRMTPPRGDNWAGSLGMVAGMLIYFQRQKLHAAIYASLVTAFFGGFGFASSVLFRLIETKTGWPTNWHSVMEQTYGFINGVGIAVAMLVLARRLPHVGDEPRVRSWTDSFAIGFTLLFVTWLNLRQNPERWVEAKTVPAVMAGLSAQVWFDLAYLALSLAVIWLLIRHRREPIQFIPANWLGKGQLLYLVFLWLIVAGNFERAVVRFASTRLITEGVIFLNAAVCTLILLLSLPKQSEVTQPKADYGLLIRKAVAAGLVVTALSTLAEWGITRAIYGNEFVGAKRQIRFGSEATATTEKPQAGQPHP
ncbi:MAG: hypothetical protein ABI977_03055 [Acidobacteriota bacterium]